MDSLKDFLKQNEFFSGLNENELSYIAAKFQMQECKPGFILIREGAQADRFFLVEEGKVEIWKKYGEKDGVRLAVHGAGGIFGEMALIDDQPRSASAVVVKKCKLLFMSKSDFQALSMEHPTIMLAVLKALSRLIRRSNDSFIESLNRRNAELQNALVEREQAQKELIRSERFSNLGKVSSLIVHDLRNPLSVIKGYGEMLQLLHSEPDQVREYSQKIVGEANRLNQFAQELLDYSRGDLRLNWVFTSFGMVFRKLTQYIERQFIDSDIDICMEYSSEAPFYIDEQRMLRVLMNLCDNARKAMPKGGTLTISAEFREEKIYFTVEDSGSGMTEDVLVHIFEPFYSSSKGGGTGLGMVSVKTIVEAHGGIVSISSSPDRGTSVTLELPWNEEMPD